MKTKFRSTKGNITEPLRTGVVMFKTDTFVQGDTGRVNPKGPPKLVVGGGV